MRKQPIIVFDVNETLLDLEAIRPTFDRIFNDPAATRDITISEADGAELTDRFATMPPHPEVPGAAALEVDPGDICLIASHVWDTIGAVAAGWQAALILRGGNAPLDVGPQPDYIGKDLDEIADQFIEQYASQPALGSVSAGSRSPSRFGLATAA
jgi:FMN phosphatase YigB (HAD superfamily)